MTIKSLMFSILILLSSFVFSQPRITSVDATATEILVGLGVEQNIVATDVTSQQIVTNKALPNLGYHRALPAEGILSTNATLIVGSNHMGPKTTIDHIQSSNIELIQLKSADTTEQLSQNIILLANRLDKKQQAELLINQLNQQTLEISQRVSPKPLNIIFLLNMNGRGLSMAGTGTTGHALITLLGGKNPTTQSGYQSVTSEALISINPDVILLGSHGTEGNIIEDFLQKNDLLKHGKAVQNNKLLSVNASKMVAGLSMGLVNEANLLSEKIYLGNVQ